MSSGRPVSFRLELRNEKAGGLSVLTASLDDLCEWEALERLDYLKIDVEGAEQEVLSGGMSALRKHRPIIQAEVSIKQVHIGLPEYSAFRAPESPNMIYIPEEHEKIDVLAGLGWRKIDRAVT